MLTLYHWDLPQALQDEYNGWESRQIIEDFTHYAETLFEAFRGKVHYWISLNEQNIFTSLGYLLAAHPPGVTDPKRMYEVNHIANLANASVINNATAPGTESAYNLDSEMDPFDKAEKERDSSGFFARFSAKIANIHSRREARLVRDEIILSRIPDKDLMEYLKLEQKRLESQQHAKEIREKRIWIAFQMTIALIAAVLVIYFLKDSPAILISILYTAGLLIAFNIWKKHKDGRSPKDQ